MKRMETGSPSGRHMDCRRWLGLTLGLTAAGLLAFGGLVAAVDPFFHFHGPAEGLSYALDSERYQNDGISRHFTYDAVMTGTSMTENFKASHFVYNLRLDSNIASLAFLPKALGHFQSPII